MIALRAAVVAEGDIFERDCACDGVERLGARLFSDGCVFVHQRKERGERRRLLVHADDESRKLIEPADQQRREGNETDDLADRELTASDKNGAGDEDRDHRQRRRRALHDGQHAPPGQDRVLRGQEIARQSSQSVGLGLRSGHSSARPSRCR